ncbi:FtsQ-type POTRA domain-containing protein [Candidatus Dojkabacteria bacterium]|nr:FtsQ-type POTRA domain-containing protein [Candidatus Dojkabacteria bacterium]
MKNLDITPDSLTVAKTVKAKTPKPSKNVLVVFWRKFSYFPLIRNFKYLWILAIAIGLFFFISRLNLFYIETINVESLNGDKLTYLDSEELEDQVVDYLGVNFFEVDTTKIEKQISNDNSFVKNVYVTKRFPSTITVRIEERQPIVVLTSKFGQNLGVEETENESFLTSVDGYILASCSNNEQLCQNLPKCALFNDPSDIKIGKKPYISVLEEIIAIEDFFNEKGIDIVKLSNPESTVIVAEFDDSTHGIFTSKSSISAQLNSYFLTRQALVVEGISFKEIDVRYDRPVYRVDKYTEWMTE